MSKQLFVIKNGTQKDIYTTDGNFVGTSFQNPDGSENFFSADGSVAGSSFQTGFGTNTFLSDGSVFSTFDGVTGIAYGRSAEGDSLDTEIFDFDE